MMHSVSHACAGSFFLKPIAQAMADAKRDGGDVSVAFKGMHEDI
jgi:hypothetical protein